MVDSILTIFHIPSTILTRSLHSCRFIKHRLPLSLNPIKKSRHLPKCTSKLVLLLVPPRATITSPLYSLYILQTRVGYILYQSVPNIHMRSLHWWFVQSSCKRTSMFPVSQSIDNMPIGLSPISNQILSLDLDIPIISRYIPSSPQNSYVVPSKKAHHILKILSLEKTQILYYYCWIDSI